MTRSGSPEPSTDGGSRPARSRRPDRPTSSTGGPTPGVAGARYGVYVVILAAILLIAFTVHVALSSHKGSTAIRPGIRVPPFAAPYAIGGPAGEVDIARHANDGLAGRVAACQERGPGILNICQLYERGPVVLALFFQAGSCAAVLTEMQQLASEFPQVGFAAVGVKDDVSSTASLVRAKRLTFPVGVDAEGRLGEALCDGELSPGHVRISRWHRAESLALEHPVARHLARTCAGACGRLARPRLEARSHVSGDVRGWGVRERGCPVPPAGSLVVRAPA